MLYRSLHMFAIAPMDVGINVLRGKTNRPYGTNHETCRYYHESFSDVELIRIKALYATVDMGRLRLGYQIPQQQDKATV